MALNKITYDNKVALNPQPSVANINKVSDTDMNEIKTCVNDNCTYSTNEICIGEWIDGKPLYRKVIETTSPLVSTDGTNAYKNVSVNVNDIDYLFIEKSLLREGNSIYTDNFSNMAGNLNFRIEANPVNKYVVMYCNNTTWSEKAVKIIINYTKTTD